ncbi:uncharacterized protein FFMR_10930 [Fusarium fujikuroi]|nr:uncharacterized protein FFE2_08206 [Fusarium fujikuroi]SCO01267.1 uncharacterized protein FFM5_07530 [Fusarium fujikuroi]SCO21522.1 uncharacterized protein FFC1_14192 [Fusarium fujikuroi]SCO46151.1 uncharacterized protein FFNC_10708 [Fusarium fujikuroi]SCO52247.1 uncharacterized protein FFMR_10930 [Fusarium fujikuroi]
MSRRLKCGCTYCIH